MELKNSFINQKWHSKMVYTNSPGVIDNNGFNAVIIPDLRLGVQQWADSYKAPSYLSIEQKVELANLVAMAPRMANLLNGISELHNLDEDIVSEIESVLSNLDKELTFKG